MGLHYSVNIKQGRLQVLCNSAKSQFAYLQ